MAGSFHRALLCAIPGVLALAGCWWLYSQWKKHASSSGEEETAAEEQQVEAPATSVEAREAASEEEQCPVGETSTSLPLEMASGASSAQTVVEEATESDESIAVKSDAVVVTSPQTEEQEQCVTVSSCFIRGSLSSPVQGDVKDGQVKNRAYSESQGAEWTPVENYGGPLEKSPLVMGDSGCCARASEGGTSAKDPVQKTTWSVASGQQLDSQRLPASQDVPAEQSSAPREKPPTLALPEGSNVTHSKWVHREDALALHGCSSGAAVEAREAVKNMDFVYSGCALQKTVTGQNFKPEEMSTKPDLVTWEIEVPKALVGRLIGKQGRFMNFLKQTSGAKIYVCSPPHLRDSQVCHIEGFSQQVEKALSLIGKKFKSLRLTNTYIPPPPTPPTPHPLLTTCWLHLPEGVPVEVVMANQVDAGHMFLQQHTHPTFSVLHRLGQQMNACYSQPDIPTLAAPVEVGTICAAPGLDGAWLRAQVNRPLEETGEVELRYVDYGGYDRVKIERLRMIRSDFLSLPFQAAEVLLDNVVPLADEDHFSSQADAAVAEMTKGAVLVAQVANYDSATGLPLVELWNLVGDEMLSVNRALVERGLAQHAA
ncbi:A-kinase anchor protein 1, mitochondrial-like [Porphyrio hochstetteri]